jgi:hypothetical protein
LTTDQHQAIAKCPAVSIMTEIYRRFGERNGRKCVDNVFDLPFLEFYSIWSRDKWNCFTAKVCHSAKEIPAEMHTSYQCKRVKIQKYKQRGAWIEHIKDYYDLTEKDLVNFKEIWRYKLPTYNKQFGEIYFRIKLWEQI